MPLIPKKIFLGLDPGVSGGMAALNERGTVVGLAQSEKMTPRDAWEWIESHAATTDAAGTLLRESFAVVELVTGYVAGSKAVGSQMGKLCASAGRMVGFLIAADVPYLEVQATRWQREFGLRKSKGEGKTSWKNRIKSRAQQLFPSVKITLATADALLMAEYARRLKSKT